MVVNLKAEIRQRKGKRSRNLLASQGKIPAVLYGKGIDSMSVAVDSKEVAKILRDFGTSQVLDLMVDNEQYKVMIKDMQQHPLSQQVMHMDFLKVDLNVLITTFVPIRLEGEPKGVKEGGTLQQQLREIEVECLPTDIPEVIEVDISHLEVGDSIHIGDLIKLKDVEFLTTPDTLIASLVAHTDEPEEEDDTEITPEIVTDTDAESEDTPEEQ